MPSHGTCADFEFCTSIHNVFAHSRLLIWPYLSIYVACFKIDTLKDIWVCHYGQAELFFFPLRSEASLHVLLRKLQCEYSSVALSSEPPYCPKHLGIKCTTCEVCCGRIPDGSGSPSNSFSGDNTIIRLFSRWK